jgi:putative tricarboxylic transport membrane protein
MKISDTIFGTAFILLALLVLWSASSLKTIPGQDVGPSAFPSLVAILLIVCGGLLTLRGLRERTATSWISFNPWTQSLPRLRNFVLVIAGLIFYVLASDAIGFHICAMLILIPLFLSLEVSWPKALIIATAATIVVHLLFYKFLKVPLPWGLLPVLW